MTDDLFASDSEQGEALRSEEDRDASSFSEWHKPLADRLRPRTFEEYLGQSALMGENGALRQLVESGRPPSMILWGPPGSGKTTLARLLATKSQADFITLSAVTSGVKDVRAVIERARLNTRRNVRTLLFVDEIHRFNKAQQDAFLPHVESGLIVLVGATTENPSFSVISPLLSRCRVFTLEALSKDDLRELLRRGTEEIATRLKPLEFQANDDALALIAGMAEGDGRRALGMLEVAADAARAAAEASDTGIVALENEVVRRVVQKHLVYDRSGEEHFNLISALHKTIRSSDPHAASYWVERMLAAGEDPLYVLRRLIRIAGEDVGLADRNAVQHAMACKQAFEHLGPPEGNLFVTQLAVYLALAPKSDAVYKAANLAAQLVREGGTQPVPMHLRNAPTGLMKELGYGRDYTYDHDAPGHFSPKQGLPDVIEGAAIYEPTDQGWEATQRERLARLDKARSEERQRRPKNG